MLIPHMRKPHQDTQMRRSSILHIFHRPTALEIYIPIARSVEERASAGPGDLLIYSEGEQPPPPSATPPLPTTTTSTIITIATPLSSRTTNVGGTRVIVLDHSHYLQPPRRGSLAKLQLMPCLQQVAGELSRHARSIVRSGSGYVNAATRLYEKEERDSRKFTGA